ncbi:fibronectin type III domain-containing protein, partial [Elusimicrobiota bacterium]
MTRIYRVLKALLTLSLTYPVLVTRISRILYSQVVTPRVLRSLDAGEWGAFFSAPTCRSEQGAPIKGPATGTRTDAPVKGATTKNRDISRYPAIFLAAIGLISLLLSSPLHADAPTSVEASAVYTTSITYNYTLDSPATETPFLAISTVSDFSVMVSSQEGTVVDETPRTTTYISLESNTTHYFKVKVATEPDVNYSSVFATSTLALPPQETFTFTNVFLSSITVSWSAPSTEASGYEITASSTGFNGTETVYSSVTYIGDLTALTLENLDINTTYYFRGKSYNWNLDLGTYSVMGTTCTLNRPPQAPFSFPNVYSTSATISWNAPAEEAEGYEITASSTDYNGTGTIYSSATLVGDLTTLTVENLVPNTTYYFRGKSYSWSLALSSYAVMGTTVAHIETPTNIYLDEISSNSIVASAYASGSAFTNLDDPFAGVNISTTGGTDWAGWTIIGDSWTTRASVGGNRDKLAGAAVGGKIYVIGGSDAGNNAIPSTFEYDPVSNSWANRADMPTEGREGLAAVTLGGKIYAIGGDNDVGDVDTNEEYDPIANSWAIRAPLPTAGEVLTAVAVNGKIYAIGGTGDTSANEEYDPATNSWTAKTNMPTGRKDLSAAVVNGKIYVIGGIGGTNKNEEYDPEGNSWVTKSDIPTVRYDHVAVALGGKIYAIGGWDGDYSSVNEVYDPTSDSWTTRKDMSQERTRPAAAAVGGKIYVIAGRAAAKFNLTEEYTPGASIKFNDLLPNTQYDFIAKGRNSNGVETQESFQISSYTAAALPAIVSTNSFQDVFYTSMTVSWVQEDNPENTEYNVEISTTQNFDGSADTLSNWTVKLSTGFEGITSNTTYYAQVKARNFDDLETRYISLGSTITLAMAPEAPFVFSVFTTSAALTWNAPSDGTAGYEITASSTEFNGTGTIYSSVTLNGDQTTLTVENLTSNTTYYFRGKSYNWHMLLSTYSVMGTTPTLALPPQAPYSFTNVFLTSIAVSWDKPSTGASGYEITASSTDFNGTGTVYSSVTYVGDLTTLTFEDLTKNTTYYFRGKTYNWNLDLGTYSVIGSTPTLIETPTSLTIDGLWVTSVTLSVGGSFTNIGLGLSGTRGSKDGVYNDDWSLWSTTPSVTSLTANAQYVFQAKARNITGRETAQTPSIINYTAAARPVVPGTVFSNVFLSSLTVTWTPNTDNPAGTEYFVEISTVSTFDASSDTTAGWAVFSSTGFEGLFINTTYYAQVKARNFDNVDTNYVNFGATSTLCNPPEGIVFDDINSTWVVVSAYRENGFGDLSGGTAGINIAKDASYGSWHVWGSSWTTKAVVLTGRANLAATVLGGKIYAIGGLNGGVRNENEEYDPVANSWVSRADMLTARQALGVAAAQGKIYAIGGAATLDTNEEYDPAANSWVTRAPMSTGRQFPAVSAVRGKIYAIGGDDGSDTAVNEEYDPATNTWTTREPMLTAREGSAVAIVGEKIYVIGGSGGPWKNEEYDPTEDSWVTRANMPSGRWSLAATVVGGRIYALGGWNDGQTKNEEYDPAANSWVIRRDIPTGGAGLAAATVGGRIYVIGGNDGDENTNEAYDPGVATKLDGLTPNTEYDFKAKARNHSGIETSETSEVSTYTAAALPLEVSTGSLSEVEFTSITVSWTANSNPALTEYLAIISTCAAYPLTCGYQSSGWITTLSTEFTDLIGITTYYASVKAKNALDLETYYTSLGSTQTDTQLLAPIPNDPTSVSSSSIQANWTDQSSPAGTTFEAQISTDSAFNPVLATSDTANAYAVLSSLDMFTTYFMRVRAEYQTDQSSWTTLPSTMTLVGPPSTFYFDEITTKTITVSPYFKTLEWIGGATAGVNISCVGVYGGWHTNGDSWDNTKAPMNPSATPFRVAAGAATVGSRIYVMGGTWDNTNGESTHEAYAPANDSWDASPAAMDTARFSFAIAAVKDKIYAIGGYDNGSTFAVNEEYDPATNTWTTREPMAANDYFTTGVAVGEKAYVIGGAAGSKNGNREYDPATNAWTALANMPTGRYWPAAAVVAGKIYVFGGTSDYTTAASVSAANEEYDPVTGDWATRASMPTARYGAGAASVGGKIYVAGGSEDNSVSFTVNELYDPATNAWTTIAPIPTARKKTLYATAVSSGNIYTFGGLSWPGTPLQTTEEYDPGVSRKFTDLVPNTQYTFKAKARDSNSNVTGESATVSTYTLAAVPTVVSTGSFQDVFSTSMTVSWGVNENPPGTEYYLQFSTYSDFLSSTDSGWIASISKEYTGLLKFTTYYARVKARNAYNRETSYISLSSTRTLVGIPDDVLFEEIGSTWIVVSAYYEEASWLGGDTAGVDISCASIYAGWHVYGDSWTTKANLPTARNTLAAVALEGKVYAIGGNDGSITDENEVYDPATNNWGTRAPLPTARSGLALAVVKGKIYAIGGSDGSATGENEEYDPITNAWTTRAAMLTARNSLGAGVAENKIYAIGGNDGSITDENEEYDPATNTWATRKPMPTARHVLTVTAAGGKIYAIGGDKSGYTDENEEYDPVANEWATRDPMPTARSNLAAAILGDK